MEGCRFPFFEGVCGGESAGVYLFCGWAPEVVVETVLPEEGYFDQDAED